MCSESVCRNNRVRFYWLTTEFKASAECTATINNVADGDSNHREWDDEAMWSVETTVIPTPFVNFHFSAFALSTHHGIVCDGALASILSIGSYANCMCECVIRCRICRWQIWLCIRWRVGTRIAPSGCCSHLSRMRAWEMRVGRTITELIPTFSDAVNYGIYSLRQSLRPFFYRRIDLCPRYMTSASEYQDRFSILWESKNRAHSKDWRFASRSVGGIVPRNRSRRHNTQKEIGECGQQTLARTMLGLVHGEMRVVLRNDSGKRTVH